MREIIEKNKQVLIMLPEIFLTTQFEKRFKDFFGFHPSVWHSKIGLKEKRKIWYGAAQNKIKVVIGARSSLFLPFKNGSNDLRSDIKSLVAKIFPMFVSVKINPSFFKNARTSNVKG